MKKSRIDVNTIINRVIAPYAARVKLAAVEYGNVTFIYGIVL
jgi:hypothetical protein